MKARTKLFIELAAYVQSKRLGVIVINEPFLFIADPSWAEMSRAPDIVFIRSDRQSQLPDGNIAQPVPDLIVEVISPKDMASATGLRIKKYLQAGVQQVWHVDSDLRTILIYKLGSKQITRLSSEDTLSGGEVIPGFEMVVAELFG